MSGKREELSDEKESSPIIVKKIKKHEHGHHGGAWKIAFADFVTAMMAFFLLMWLLASLNKAQKEGIADYFKQPIKIGLLGGDSMGDRALQVVGGGKNIEEQDGSVSASDKPVSKQKSTAEIKDPGQRAVEIKALNELRDNIMLAMKSDPALDGLKKQLLMDDVKDGLRIQLIDNKDQPMFGIGSDEMSDEMKQMLQKIAKVVNQVDNKISIQGHTDAHPYHNPEDLEQTNWELSTQRANAARRALVASGVSEDKFLRITGYSSTILFNPGDPFDARNRRISIIVMKKDSEIELLKGQ
ncbi:flagellar motor protein MotB [Legionella sp. W05-934-2]|jgi:chemotaxis protein MotB|uniref:flagellar motor protein MotB n=1 Tax=Legionella sp. W05-934-2 TaxID=1198649 RepID=UPI0034636789